MLDNLRDFYYYHFVVNGNKAEKIEDRHAALQKFKNAVLEGKVTNIWMIPFGGGEIINLASYPGDETHIPHRPIGD